jgi:hypothetical protein
VPTINCDPPIGAHQLANGKDQLVNELMSGIPHPHDTNNNDQNLFADLAQGVSEPQTSSQAQAPEGDVIRAGVNSKGEAHKMTKTRADLVPEKDFYGSHNMHSLYLGGALVECPKKGLLFLMKLWALIVIGLIKMCTKFWQKKCQEVPLLHAKPCLKNCIENPMGQ